MMLTVPQINGVLPFDPATVDRHEMIRLIRAYDGPSGRVIVGLLLELAKQYQFKPITIVDIFPERQHGWSLDHFPNAGLANDFASKDGPDDIVQSSLLGNYERHGELRHFVLRWVGVKPDPQAVRKKMKEYGVRFLSDE